MKKNPQNFINYTTLLSRYIQKENKEAAVIQLLAELKGNSF
jgi:hypothetical protein